MFGHFLLVDFFPFFDYFFFLLAYLPFARKYIRTISGFFWNYSVDSNSILGAAEFFLFERFEFLVCSGFKHTVWLSMCLCCGPLAPTPFHFECGGVLDDS